MKIDARAHGVRSMLMRIGLATCVIIASCSGASPRSLQASDVLVAEGNTEETRALLGSTVSGDITVSLSVDRAVRLVEFYLDDAEDAEGVAREEPYEMQLDTTTVDNGPHSLRLRVLMPEEAYPEELELVVSFGVWNGAGSGKLDTQLLGDPLFDQEDLPSEARAWYQRFLSALASSRPALDVMGAAMSGDIYNLGRPVHDHVTLLFSLFRQTGDLRLLDEVDELMQAARGQLADYNDDGFLNWRQLHARDSKYYGDDWHNLDESMTHGLIAEVAWAYHLNRYLTSPSGVDYEERAEFWLDYLLNHFEAKWRRRSRVSESEMEFLPYYLLHPYAQFTRYYWYMYKLTGSELYYEEAVRRAGIIHENLVLVPLTSGDAYVYPWGVVTEGNARDELMPVTYGRYVVQSIEDLVLDGFDGFDLTDLERFAVGTRVLIMNDGVRSYAETVGGNGPIAGLEIGHTEGVKDGNFWSTWAYAPALVRYDESGQIASNSEALNAAIENNINRPRRPFLSGALFLHEMDRID